MPRAAAGRGRGGGKGRGAAAAGYNHSAALSEGTVLTDFFKKEWVIHQPVGQGGFGVLYLASKRDSKSKEAEFVVKIEPKDNGPLFCECTFYQRAGKPELIKKWLDSTKRKAVGMPKFIAFGFHEMCGVENRFMVMERFGKDLQKIFVENSKRFSRKTVLQVALRVLDVLEYIHSRDYVHADIKAANLLLGHKNSNQVFLVDYGLAARYRNGDGSHIGYKEDPRKAHDGTIEFTSRDAHRGVASSRRSDLEILGYCLLQWLCGELPWENKLSNKVYVKDQKIRYMDDIPALMAKCFKGGDYPSEIEEYLEYVAQLDYTETPDYKKIRNIFQSAMNAQFYKDDKLNFILSVSDELGRVPTSPRRKMANGIPPSSPKKRARKSSPHSITESESQYPTPAKSKRVASARAIAAESQCPTPVKRASTARATPRKRKTDLEVKVEPPSPEMDAPMPTSNLRGKRKSDTPPEPVSPAKQVKRPSAARKRSQKNLSSDDDSVPGSSSQPVYEFMMKTKTTIRKVHRGLKDVASKGTQTSPGLKGLNPRKRKT